MRALTLILGLILISTASFASSKGESHQKNDDLISLIVSCNSSNSLEFKAIEIYGTIDSDGVTIKNVTTIVSTSFMGEATKLLKQSGSGVGGQFFAEFEDTIEPNGKFRLHGSEGKLILKDKEVIFSDCKNLAAE